MTEATQKKPRKTLTFRPGPGNLEVLDWIIENVGNVSNPSDACRHAIDLAKEYYGIKIYYDEGGKPLRVEKEGTKNKPEACHDAADQRA